jgi:hypothetical protein
MLKERLLKACAGICPRCKTLDRGDLPARYLAGSDQAGADGFAVEQNCAGAAVTGIATNLSADETEVLAQDTRQPLRWR